MTPLDRANQVLSALLSNPAIMHQDQDGNVEVEKIWHTEKGEQIGKYYTVVDYAAQMAQELAAKVERLNF
jgi:hypothetical protein